MSRLFLLIDALLLLYFFWGVLTGKRSCFFAWYDLWVGAYWDGKNRILYICPLPCCVIAIPVKKATVRHRWKYRNPASRQCEKCGEYQDFYVNVWDLWKGNPWGEWWLVYPLVDNPCNRRAIGYEEDNK